MVNVYIHVWFIDQCFKRTNCTAAKGICPPIVAICTSVFREQPVVHESFGWPSCQKLPQAVLLWKCHGMPPPNHFHLHATSCCHLISKHVLRLGQTNQYLWVSQNGRPINSFPPTTFQILQHPDVNHTLFHFTQPAQLLLTSGDITLLVKDTNTPPFPPFPTILWKSACPPSVHHHRRPSLAPQIASSPLEGGIPCHLPMRCQICKMRTPWISTC